MTLASAIRENALTEAQAGDWQAVAEIISAISTRQTPRSCFGVESADALDAVGNRRRSIMQALSQDPDGQFVMTKLAGNGVVWAHPMTVSLMDVMVSAGVMQTVDKTALVNLSSPITLHYPEATAEQCRVAWIRDDIQTRVDVAKNQIGTSEQAQAVATFAAIAGELEAV